MISVAEAFKIAQENAFIPPIHEVDLMKSLGYILAENIVADRDFPPFNRVAMDGIGLNLKHIDLSTGIIIENSQFAGEPQKTLQNSTKCMEVMTGAILPLGCDTVIRYEDLENQEINHEKSVKITLPFSEISIGKNVHVQGSDRKAGDILLKKGLKISPAEIAVMASVGKVSVWVQGHPKVAIISTGDELVAIDTLPEPYQIRTSNAYMLAAALQQVGAETNTFHLTDDEEILYNQLEEIIKNHDILLLSGGVSAGKKDYVPAVLERLGVSKKFHKVAQKPGKPMWFGKTDDGKSIFALPGNPVSTFLCFCKYVLPSIKGKMVKEEVILAKPVIFKPDLSYFVPVKTHFETGKLMAIPFEGSGSADFANLTDCDGFIELPANQQHFEAGQVFNFIRFR